MAALLAIYSSIDTKKRNNIILEISFQNIAQNSIFLLNVSCLISDSTKTTRLQARDFYEVIVYTDYKHTGSFSTQTIQKFTVSSEDFLSRSEYTGRAFARNVEFLGVSFSERFYVSAYSMDTGKVRSSRYLYFTLQAMHRIN